MTTIPTNPDDLPLAGDAAVTARSGAATDPTLPTRIGAGAGDDSVDARIARVFGDTHRRRRGRWLALFAVVAAVAVVGVVAWTRTSGAATGNYVTARAAVADVAAQYQNVASIVPVNGAAVAFPVAGTVDTVDVSLGDTVTTGQQLATLDTTSLTDTLHQKQAALTQAQLTLQKALDGESTPTTGSSGAGSTGSGGGAATFNSATTSSSTGGSEIILTAATQTTGSSQAQITAAQQAVVAAQQEVDAALAAADKAMQTAATVCASGGGGSSSTTTSTTTPDTSACTNALADVQTAQQAVATAQKDLAAASTALDQFLASQAAAGGNTGGSGSGSGSRSGSGNGSFPSASGSGSGSGAGGSGSASTSSAPSAAQLVADQKAVDAAEAAVTVAEQAIAQATVHSPISGTVVAVAITPGATVTAGSSTQTITIQGDQGYEAVTTVGLTEISTIAAGQSATLVPDGQHTALPGKVVAISTVADSSSSATTFQVTIGLDDPGTALGNGATGTVTITTAAATRALTVPTSAITATGAGHTATVLHADGTTATTQVQVGVVGTERTQITGGLTAGQTVVLADLDQALPNSATDSTTNGTNGNRNNVQLPGGGQLPGGFGGAGFARQNVRGG
jgi:HlyD family secretion protein